MSLIVDSDRSLRAVLGTETRLLRERVPGRFDEEHAMAEVVGSEDVGREGIATAVADAEVLVDAYFHTRILGARPRVRARRANRASRRSRGHVRRRHRR